VRYTKCENEADSYLVTAQVEHQEKGGDWPEKAVKKRAGEEQEPVPRRMI
jgi:hypothetical protein